jgi:hypothetical protein
MTLIMDTRTGIPLGVRRRDVLALIIELKFEFTGKVGLMQEGIGIKYIYGWIWPEWGAGIEWCFSWVRILG